MPTSLNIIILNNNNLYLNKVHPYPTSYIKRVHLYTLWRRNVNLCKFEIEIAIHNIKNTNASGNK